MTIHHYRQPFHTTTAAAIAPFILAIAALAWMAQSL